MNTKVSSKATLGDLRVWWIPQVPGTPFHVPVKNIDEAKLLLKTLANYDLFQLKNKIKGDYCNAGGLEICEVYAPVSGEGSSDNEWCEWCNEDGDSIDDVMKKER